jgi:DNA-binding MarR family transcriptional regulator
MGFDPKDIELAAFAPRQKILETLQKQKKPATNAELAEKCGLTKRKVSYNMSKLAEAGLIKVELSEKGMKCISITRKGLNVLASVRGEKQDLKEVH